MTAAEAECWSPTGLHDAPHELCSAVSRLCSETAPGSVSEVVADHFAATRGRAGGGPAVAALLLCLAEGALSAWRWAPRPADVTPGRAESDVGETSLAGAPPLVDRQPDEVGDGSVGDPSDSEWLANQIHGSADEEALMVEREVPWKDSPLTRSVRLAGAVHHGPSDAVAEPLAKPLTGAQASEWALEVERMGRKLRFRAPPAARRWRPTLASWTSAVPARSTRGFTGSARQAVSVGAGGVESLAGDLSRVGALAASDAGRISAAERGLYDSGVGVGDAAEKRLRAWQSAEQYAGAERVASDRVTRLAAELAEAEADLADVAAAVTAAAGRSSDVSPITAVRNALATLRTETRRVDLQIGVLRSQVDRLRLANAAQSDTIEDGDRSADDIASIS